MKPHIQELLHLDNSRTLLIYDYSEGNQCESGFHNLYGMLIDPETGSLLGEEVQLSNLIGKENINLHQ